MSYPLKWTLYDSKHQGGETSPRAEETSIKAGVGFDPLQGLRVQIALHDLARSNGYGTGNFRSITIPPASRRMNLQSPDVVR
jgi:hypothetical protein